MSWNREGVSIRIIIFEFQPDLVQHVRVRGPQFLFGLQQLQRPLHQLHVQLFQLRFLAGGHRDGVQDEEHLIELSAGDSNVIVQNSHIVKERAEFPEEKEETQLAYMQDPESWEGALLATEEKKNWLTPCHVPVVDFQVGWRRAAGFAALLQVLDGH